MRYGQLLWILWYSQSLMRYATRPRKLGDVVVILVRTAYNSSVWFDIQDVVTGVPGIASASNFYLVVEIENVIRLPVCSLGTAVCIKSSASFSSSLWASCRSLGSGLAGFGLVFVFSHQRLPSSTLGFGNGSG